MTEILKKAGETAPVAGGKIVVREVMTASGEAARVLAAARREAQEILAGAVQARQEAVESGLRQGFEQGAEQWAEALRLARERVAEAAQHARPEIVRLALRVAEKILRQRIETHPDSIVPMVDEALKVFLAQNHSRVILRVHPADESVLVARRQRWLERNPAIGDLAIVPDDAVGRGGCRLETEAGTVDATLETQLEVIERHLLGEGSRQP
jgi:flagellar biosynthesis/type III secretory pathway protein FliH